MLFRDREEAGKKLALALTKYRGLAEVVLSFPRGVICGRGVANHLELPHDLIFINRISHPRSPEYAVGAVNENGAVILRGEAASLDKQWLDEEIERKKVDIRRRRHVYLTNRPPVALYGKIVVIVDEGLADDLLMSAAVEYVLHHKAARIIVAVPIAYTEAAKKIEQKTHELVALHTVDEPFISPSHYYLDFKDTSDNEVLRIMETQHRL